MTQPGKPKITQRPARPVQGPVDYDALIKAAMEQYRKVRAWLAKH